MTKKKIVFLHPDLGIGGAERLVVDAALALESRGHTVQFVTNHHDPNHCFEETINQLKVTVVGDWIPRSCFGRMDKFIPNCLTAYITRLFAPLIAEEVAIVRCLQLTISRLKANCSLRFRAFWAYIRMMYAALYISLWGVTDGGDEQQSRYRPDVVICDQISACIPFLKLNRMFPFKYLPSNIANTLLPYAPKRIVFYCHFPDKLLTRRENILKRLYRLPIDKLEEKTTGLADEILVNSRFTAGIFHDTFRSLNNIPDVLYPSLNTKPFDESIQEYRSLSFVKAKNTFTLLSINRYERKKNLQLALRTLAQLRKKGISHARLLMVGGHDPLCVENVEHLQELQQLAQELNLSTEGNNADVSFETNVTTQQKVQYLRACDVLLYTPSGEHFGIVPIEAMYVGTPVIAVNDGAGPTETVLDDETGFLCPANDDVAFANAAAILAHDKSRQKRMADAGRERVRTRFSFDSFADQLDIVVNKE